MSEKSRFTKRRVMAKCEMKKIVSILVLIMFVVAQADDSPPSSSSSRELFSMSTIGCVGNCASRQCRALRRFIHVYAACTAGCGVVQCSGVSATAANEMSSTATYDCATSCAISKSRNVHTGIHTNFYLLHYMLV